MLLPPVAVGQIGEAYLIGINSTIAILTVIWYLGILAGIVYLGNRPQPVPIRRAWRQYQ